MIEEVVAGETLDKIIKTEGQLSEKQVRNLLLNLLPALQELHQKSLLHRDIRPENIVYSQNSGEFLLTNLGLPQMVAEHLREGIPSIGEYLLGDPSYSALEQVGGKASCTSDLYSLGVFCLEAITGTKPIDLMILQGTGWEYQPYLESNPISQQLQKIIEQLAIPSILDGYTHTFDVLASLTEDNNTSSVDFLEKFTSATAAAPLSLLQFTSATVVAPLSLLQSGAGLLSNTFSKVPSKKKSSFSFVLV